MRLIDRYILVRFLANFITLFLLLFVFAASIDLILNLDRFVDAARAQLGDDAGFLVLAGAFVRVVLDFEGPRVFEFYAYLHGLVTIGAMGFTLAQMHRHKELVAILASGVSLQRLAMPFIAAVFGLSLVQLLNQELILPRLAPLLLRSHGHLGKESVTEFEVRLTRDAHGALLQAPSFDPRTNTLTWPTILERDERGRTVRRITAESARWDEQRDGWQLINGAVVTLADPAAEQTQAAGPTQRPVDFYATDLSPEVLTVRRYGQFAAMLSLTQISRMLKTPGIAGERTLLRYRYSRFASVLVNVLVLVVALPSFLLREPVSLLLQTMRCAAVGITAMIGAAIFMMVDLPGIAPAVGVFLPAVILLPIALARVTYIKT